MEAVPHYVSCLKIVTVITKMATLSAKVHFFFIQNQMREKEDGFNFVLVSQLRNMSEWFLKTYLHRLNHSAISYTQKNAKMFNINSKCFSIFDKTTPASWLTRIKRDFSTCYSCCYYSSIDITLKINKSNNVNFS